LEKADTYNQLSLLRRLIRVPARGKRGREGTIEPVQSVRSNQSPLDDPLGSLGMASLFEARGAQPIPEDHATPQRRWRWKIESLDFRLPATEQALQILPLAMMTSFEFHLLSLSGRARVINFLQLERLERLRHFLHLPRAAPFFISCLCSDEHAQDAQA